ncbi:replication initiation protein [Seohaeicola sp. 4SK31]|uniref:replication initiation protein n=2 Tax=unclassified Seohaeicola TaxID=2641111 RepID=UPI00237BFBE2|nr:replication initiation protein [Seohaeicola sp. 4SK31]MDD9709871.1 replication initiation protein [Seohaeicola sp. 4SK31]
MELKKTYPVSWVVMQNTIQECFKSMSIDEKRLLILASPIARTMDATEKDAITITSEEFAKECGIKTNSAYSQMEEASKSLLRRYFSYGDNKKKTYCNWVIRAIYENGAISICFPDEVLLMLKEFDKLNPYTKYKKDIVLSLKKDYSFDLYHLAKKHQAMGHFEMSLEHIKSELGLPKSYDKLCNLKDRVIKPSLDEITKNTDINLTYENVKKGRSVVGFKFTVKEKTKPKLIASERDQKTIDMFCKLSDAQINKYSSILSRVSDISDLSTFPTYDAFALWIANILRDPKSVREETAKRIFTALHQYTDFK